MCNFLWAIVEMAEWLRIRLSVNAFRKKPPINPRQPAQLAWPSCCNDIIFKWLRRFI